MSKLTQIGIFFFAFIIISCKSNNSDNKNTMPFKYGVFKIPAGKGYSETIITRKDSLQIEKYTKYISISTDSTVTQKEEVHIDTLYIKWKNNFAYYLTMKSPKTDLDKEQIFVQITKVTDSSYNFTAKIGYSNFKQKGTVYKAQ